MNLYDSDGVVIIRDPQALVAKFIGNGVTIPVKSHQRHGPSVWVKGMSHIQYMRRRRAANVAMGLSSEGRPLQNRRVKLKSMSKSKFLQYKRENRYWRKALANLWEQAGDGVFGATCSKTAGSIT